MTEKAQKFFRIGNPGDARQPTGDVAIHNKARSVQRDTIKIRHATVIESTVPDLSGAERVVGIEDREIITTTDVYPWSAVCSLRSRWGGAHYIGTGWMVTKNVVVTAGHNLFTRSSGWADSVEVTPGRHGDHAPFGSCVTRVIRVAKEWFHFQRPAADIGVILCEEGLTRDPGYFGISATGEHIAIGKSVNISGYPKETKNPEHRMPMGEFQFHHSDLITGITDRRLAYQVDTSGGNSGAPVWVETNEGPIVHGIHAYGFMKGQQPPFDRWNSAARIDEHRFDLLEQLIEEVQIGR